MDIVFERSIINAKAAFNRQPSAMLHVALEDAVLAKNLELMIKITRSFPELYLENAKAFCESLGHTFQYFCNAVAYKIFQEVKEINAFNNRDVVFANDDEIRASNHEMAIDLIVELFRRGIVSCFDEAMENGMIAQRFLWVDVSVKMDAIRLGMSRL
jgi:hypothetical protein